MQTMKQAAAEFLAGKRVAVTGVSRNPQGHGSNVVYQRLRQRGYQVFAVNPNADQVEGDTCYHDLASVPGGVDWVVIGTKPQTAEATMRECADLGIKRVWMHRGPGAGSVSPEAAEYGRQHGITVIEGGCPCMFDPTADPGHKAMRFVFTLTGNVPRRVLRHGLHDPIALTGVFSVRQLAVARAWPVAACLPAVAAARSWPGGCDGSWR